MYYFGKRVGKGVLKICCNSINTVRFLSVPLGQEVLFVGTSVEKTGGKDVLMFCTRVTTLFLCIYSTASKHSLGIESVGFT